MYKSYAHPLFRVVHGLPNSWEPSAATLHTPSYVKTAAWSLCNRFLAVVKDKTVEILDAVTLSLLNTFVLLDLDTRKLSFSSDSSVLTQFNRSGLTTWDLQTGCSVSTTFPNGHHLVYLDLPLAYSMDRKMLAVVFRDDANETFIAIHNYSTRSIHYYCVPRGHVVASIWTHNKFLQFATVESEHITIWKVGFTMAHPPEVIKILPVPDEIKILTVPDEIFYTHIDQSLFLPMHSQLFVIISYELLVWDAQDSKILLRISPFHAHHISVASNGHSFAYNDGFEVCVWKETHSGYILHQRITPFSHRLRALYISPNGGSIALSLDSAIHLWHLKDPILPPTKKHHQAPFILRFSPTQTLAAFWREWENTVIILNLQSGELQLTIDTDMGMGFGGLGITESTTVIVGWHNIITRNLSMENATNDSTQITKFDHPGGSVSLVTVSPDLSQIAALCVLPNAFGVLNC